MRRILALSLSIILLPATGGASGYVRVATVLRAGRSAPLSAALPSSAIRLSPSASFPGVAGALPGGGMVLPNAPKLSQSPEAVAPEGVAGVSAPVVLAARTPPASSVGAAAALTETVRVLAPGKGRMDAARHSRMLGGLFDNVRRMPVAQIDAPAGGGGLRALAGLDSAETGGERPAAFPDAVPAPGQAGETPPVPGWSWLPSRTYARWAGWWLQPVAALIAAKGVHAQFAAQGMLRSLDATTSAFASGALSVLAFSALTAAAAVLPRVLNRAAARDGKSFMGRVSVGAAAGAAAGGLYAAAMLVPLGTGLPSMALLTASVAVVSAWMLAYASAAPRAPPARQERPLRSFVIIGSVAPLLLLADKIWSDSALPILTLAAAYGMALLDLGEFWTRKALRAVLLSVSPRWRADPVSLDRRWFMGRMFSMAGLALFGAASGASAAALFYGPLDKRFHHVRPDIRWETGDEDLLRGGEAEATPGAIASSIARLKAETDPEKAARESYRLNVAVRRFVEEKSYRGRAPLESFSEYDYEADRRWGKNPAAKEAQDIEPQKFLIDFLADPSAVAAPSAGAREMVLQTKRVILDALSERFNSLAAQDASFLFERLWALRGYSEVIVAADPRYPAFGFSEEERLSLGLRTSLDRLFRRLAEREDWIGKAARAERDGDGAQKRERRYGAIAGVIRSWLTRATFIEEEISTAALRKARREAVHVIGIENLWMVRELRSLPREAVSAVADSAAAHGLDAGMLMTNLVAQVERQYYLSEGLSIYADRKSNGTPADRWKASVARVLAQLAPRDARLPVHWNDFLGGVLLAGKNGMGLFQIRPANVRRFPEVWSRFGVPDAGALSDREIAYRLMDSRYNAEAWAVILRGMAREVDGLRRKASRGEDLDFSGYAKESKVWLRAGSASEYALLPPLSEAGEDAWRLTAFHPLLRDKAGFHLQGAALVHQSGILDERPAVFSGVTDESAISKLAALLEDPDPFFQNAARATLEAVAQQPAHPQRARARRLLAAPPALVGEVRSNSSMAAVALAGALGAASLRVPLTRRALLGLGAGEGRSAGR